MAGSGELLRQGGRAGDHSVDIKLDLVGIAPASLHESTVAKCHHFLKEFPVLEVGEVVINPLAQGVEDTLLHGVQEARVWVHLHC